MGAQCTSAFFPFKLPDLQLKNTYNFGVQQQSNSSKQFNQVANMVFNNNYDIIKVKATLINHLMEMGEKQRWSDPNFQLKGQRLSHLYDMRRKLMALYTYQNRPGLAIMQQQQIQLSYLSAVMFFLCENKQFLRKRILLTQSINYSHQIYAMRLFCNGQQHIVLVDDIVPVTPNNNLRYTLLREKQTWPVLLQKAWCKMIGGYQHALGLSPEECFSEVTGLPAFSVRVDMMGEMTIYSEILRYQAMGCWLCVVAYGDTEVVRPGQVFVVEKVDDQFISLASPYTLNIKPSPHQPRPGYLRIQFHRFRTLFQHLIVGYIKPSYTPISLPITSQKRQQKLYQLYIKQKQDVSIRFTQFFSGYLDDVEKSNYQYSALTIMQLYDGNGMLHFCQGCERLYAGAHAVYVTKNIFHTLNKGTYFLRLEVDWQHPTRVNAGNIVIYASQNNVQIEQCLDHNQLTTLHRRTLDNPKSVVIPDDVDGMEHQYQLRFIEKRTNILISVENKVDRLLSLELNFSDSANFRVKYGKLQGNKRVVINLGPQQTKYLQIMPQNLKKQFKIQPFTVKKLPLAQQ